MSVISTRMESKPIKHRHELHITRKAWHMIGVLFMLGVYQALTRQQSLLLLTGMVILFVPFDILRLRNAKINNWFIRKFSLLLRSNERAHLTATTHLLIGAFVTVYLFPKNIATLSLMMVGVGDPIASVVGVMYGKDKIIGNKSLQGTFACFVACAISSGIFYYHQNLMSDRIVLVSVISGFIGAIAELIPFKHVDDNLSSPILSSILLWVLYYFFGGFH